MLTRRSVLAWLAALPFGARLTSAVPVSASLAVKSFHSMSVDESGAVELTGLDGQQFRYGSFAEMMEAVGCGIQIVGWWEVRSMNELKTDPRVQEFLNAVSL